MHPRSLPLIINLFMHSWWRELKAIFNSTFLVSCLVSSSISTAVCSTFMSWKLEYVVWFGLTTQPPLRGASGERASWEGCGVMKTQGLPLTRDTHQSVSQMQKGRITRLWLFPALAFWFQNSWLINFFGEMSHVWVIKRQSGFSIHN